MDIGSILQLALPVALGAAGTLKAAEKLPDTVVPITPDTKGRGLTLLGAAVVLLTTVYKASEGRTAEIDPAEVVMALGVAYGASVGLVGGFSAFMARTRK